MQKAISEAKVLLLKEDVTQEELDAALKAINDPINAISKKTNIYPDTGDDFRSSVMILLASLSSVVLFTSLAKRKKRAILNKTN